MSVEELQRRLASSKAAAPASRNVKEIPQLAACLHFLHLIFMQYLLEQHFLSATRATLYRPNEVDAEISSLD